MESGRSSWRSYVHIADVLRDRIRAGTYPAATFMPSEKALSDEFGVVRNTLRRALAELDTEGLIETVPGRGRRVRPPAERPDATGNALRYRRIAADLTAAVTSGELRPGDDLPSEAELVRRYQVSRGTVRQALAALDTAGLIDSRQGRPRRVRPV